MAKAAVLESTSLPTSFPFGRARSDVTMKRKTPSELRGEQLKRRNGVHVDEEQTPLLASDRINGGAIDGLKKPESSKVPKYINTRVDEVYSVKKSSERCRVLYGKENAKEPSTISEKANDFIGPAAASSIRPKGKSLLACGNADYLNNAECSNSSAKEVDQGFRKIEKCSLSALRNVVELHKGNEKISDTAKVDMEKALKGFVARDISATSRSSADAFGKHTGIPSISSLNFSSEFQIPGQKAPLDFSLKTTFRLVSSSSVKWCHRLSTNPTTINIGHFSSQFCCKKDQKCGCRSDVDATAETMYSKALHSWAYPQSSLPPSIISAMALSALKGEKDFLSKRQQDWEDSFRNLYYMLRKNMCSIFYVYTTQFVVLFVGGNFLGKKKRSCNAYLSQSTRGLRSLLRKHDVSFSMPLCHLEVEQATEDDLAELSEIEKRNLGQTFHLDSSSDADNSPQSLLAFIGNENVHGLYDFLLNYRFSLNSFTSADVPVLYAPVPFQNASVCVPEVRCKEMKRADVGCPSSGSETKDTDGALGLSARGICYVIEIKDTILPPWIVTAICVAMSSEGRAFEASFTTEPSSIGLNVAIDSICSTTSSASSLESGDAFGIPEAVVTPCLRSAFLKHLKHSDSSYVAYATLV